MTGPNYIEPNAALVQATADLLAARVSLYKVQPNHELIRLVDSALTSFLSPHQLNLENWMKATEEQRAYWSTLEPSSE